MQNFLEREEYEEPRCPLCDPGQAAPLPVGRILEKLDAFLFDHDYPAAVRHIRYWLAEADATGDGRGKLTLLNEAVGLARKLGEEETAMARSAEALALAASLGMEDTVTMGTTLINVATAYKAFDRAGEAVPLYQQAQTILEARLPANDVRLAGLYNNMALALAALDRCGEANRYFSRALQTLARIPDTEAEQAVTWCNLADMAEVGCPFSEEGGTRVSRDACLARAMAAFRAGKKRDGDFAYAVEKCTPVFADYGRAEDACELEALLGSLHAGA